jgi:hypothetical protein
MTQHFLLSRPAKTLSLAQVFRMTDTEAEAMFRKVRWSETDGAPVCPHCGGLNAMNAAARMAYSGSVAGPAGRISRLRAGRSLRSKLPLGGYLAAIVIFCNEVKGKSAWQSHAILAYPIRPHSYCFISFARPWPKK